MKIVSKKTRITSKNNKEKDSDSDYIPEDKKQVAKKNLKGNQGK